MRKVDIYDTTLRDGEQQVGVCFSAHDKVSIAHRLDGIASYIEFGYAGANPKNREAFKLIAKNPPKRAKIVAFGKTCSRGIKPEDDKGLAFLLDTGTCFTTIVGKGSRYQAEKVLGVTASQNLKMIETSCAFLVQHGCYVFFDAEHFFDGFKVDAAYSLKCLQTAVNGGASCLVLCDTNGGSLPWFVEAVTKRVKAKLALPIGIHCHNDCGLAVVNSLSAVMGGATQVQATINGYGERCGNADLCSVAVCLQTKMGRHCVTKENLAMLTGLARSVAEIANLPLNSAQPFVGKNAFVDKGGLHASAVLRDRDSYRHMDPALVGNTHSVVVSDLAGKSNILMKAREFGIVLSESQIKSVLAKVEAKENNGFQFDGADGSLKLMMLRQMKGYMPPFNVFFRDVRSQTVGRKNPVDSAIVKVKINGGRHKVAHEVANGDGPVNALDRALRKALQPYFPFLSETKLVDYKVRVLSGKKGTAKAVRILIDFSDGKEEWTTVCCSTDIIEASLMALVDGFEYAILKAQ